MSKHYLVTGASRGIGSAITHQLINRGDRVTGLARQFDDALFDHEHIQTIKCDLQDLQVLPAQLNKIATECPDLDAIILNAGVGQFGNLEEFSYAQIQHLFNLNLISPTYVARALLPVLKRRGHGSLLIIGSEAAVRGGRKGAVYSASKSGLRGLAQALREECAASGVRVCLVNPGMVDTSFFEQLNFAPGDCRDNYLTADEVATMVVEILQLPDSVVVDELNLSPLKKVVRKKT